MSDAVEPKPEPFNGSEQAPDLNALVAKWRWLVPDDIKILIKWEPDLRAGTYAECMPLLELNTLMIRVAVPTADIDIHGFELEKRDVESDVVHELLHWRFAHFEPKSKSMEYRLWESAIERTAKDYLKIDRRLWP